MSYEHTNETEVPLRQEIDAMLRQAEETDAVEDAQYGKDKRGDELPAELQRRESRLKKIAEAKAALEEKAKEEAAQQRAEAEQKLAEREEEEQRTGKKMPGHKPELLDLEQRPCGSVFVVSPDSVTRSFLGRGYATQADSSVLRHIRPG
jgi:beta-phosphoglucomutase-like phosphatase (HAD superfamily)